MVVLSSLLTGLPTTIVDVVLIAVAVAKWNKHPQASMFAAAGGGLLLALDVFARAAFMILPIKLRESGRTAAELGTMLSAMGLLSSLLHAVAMGLIIAAIFGERGDTRPRQL